MYICKVSLGLLSPGPACIMYICKVSLRLLSPGPACSSVRKRFVFSLMHVNKKFPGFGRKMNNLASLRFVKKTPGGSWRKKIKINYSTPGCGTLTDHTDSLIICFSNYADIYLTCFTDYTDRIIVNCIVNCFLTNTKAV